MSIRPLVEDWVPDESDWEIWQEMKVTRFVARGMKAAADEYLRQWINHSWDCESPDKDTLLKLKARAEECLAFLDASKEQYEYTIRHGKEVGNQDSRLGKLGHHRPE